MTRRRKPRTKSRPKPRATRAAQPAPAAGGNDQPADERILPLLERYCGLTGAELVHKGADLRLLKLPPAERAHFRGRVSLPLALTLDALARHPDAEIAALGSPFLSQLIDAIRTRAGRLALGLIPPPGEPAAAAPDVPVRDATMRQVRSGIAAHPVGRLVARVVLRAGATVEEAVVESAAVDLSTGVPLPEDVAAAFHDLATRRTGPADPATLPDGEPVASLPAPELVERLLGNLREQSAARVAERRATAEREVAVELDRLDRYFASILADKDDGREVEAITALHERRRNEEVRRHQVSVTVHPVQLAEARLLVQHAEWELRSAQGRTARLAAERPLAGGAGWIVSCPQCGRPPATLVVCRHEHSACDACASRCTVCEEDVCAEHGIALCRVDDEAVCRDHARECPSCRMTHCSSHEGVCTEGDHAACTACLAPCGSCGRVVCNRHVLHSGPDAPKGSRRFCAACVRYCEGGGGINELVGADETTSCATCDKAVCSTHQAVCVVDQQAHCARHLLATDASQRLVCAKHRAGCAEEPGAVFAMDEVAPCPVCGRYVCGGHRVVCGSCGRAVCTADVAQPSGHCSTCEQLVAVADPPPEALTAARAATPHEATPAGTWRTARDQTHLVAELDRGTGGRSVFWLRRGESTPERVVTHAPDGQSAP